MATRSFIILALAVKMTWSTPLQAGLKMGSKGQGGFSGSIGNDLDLDGAGFGGEIKLEGLGLSGNQGSGIEHDTDNEIKLRINNGFGGRIGGAFEGNAVGSGLKGFLGGANGIASGSTSVGSRSGASGGISLKQGKGEISGAGESHGNLEMATLGNLELNGGSNVGGSMTGSGEAGISKDIDVSRLLGMSLNGNAFSSQADEKISDDGTRSESGVSSGTNLKIDGEKKGDVESGLSGNVNLGLSGVGLGASPGTGIDVNPWGAYNGDIDLGNLASYMGAPTHGSSGISAAINGLGGTGLNSNFELEGGRSGKTSLDGNIQSSGQTSLQSSFGGSGGSLDVSTDSLGSAGAVMSGTVGFLPTLQVLNAVKGPLYFLRSGIEGAANALLNTGSSETPGGNLNVIVPSLLSSLRQLVPKFNARVSRNGGGDRSDGISASGGLKANSEILQSVGLQLGSGPLGAFTVGGGGMMKGSEGGLRLIKAGGNMSGSGGVASVGQGELGTNGSIQANLPSLGLNMGVPTLKLNLRNRFNQNPEIIGNLNTNFEAAGNLRRALKLPSIAVSVGSN